MKAWLTQGVVKAVARYVLIPAVAAGVGALAAASGAMGDLTRDILGRVCVPVVAAAPHVPVAPSPTGLK